MEWAISTPPLFQVSILVFLVSTWTAQVTNLLMQKHLEVVAGAGIEPATRGFSIRCSTN